jgi:hypothetical protein
MDNTGIYVLLDIREPVHEPEGHLSYVYGPTLNTRDGHLFRIQLQLF